MEHLQHLRGSRVPTAQTAAQLQHRSTHLQGHKDPSGEVPGEHTTGGAHHGGHKLSAASAQPWQLAQGPSQAAFQHCQPWSLHSFLGPAALPPSWAGTHGSSQTSSFQSAATTPRPATPGLCPKSLSSPPHAQSQYQNSLQFHPFSLNSLPLSTTPGTEGAFSCLPSEEHHLSDTTPTLPQDGRDWKGPLGTEKVAQEHIQVEMEICVWGCYLPMLS